MKPSATKWLALAHTDRLGYAGALNNLQYIIQYE